MCQVLRSLSTVSFPRGRLKVPRHHRYHFRIPILIFSPLVWFTRRENTLQLIAQFAFISTSHNKDWGIMGWDSAIVKILFFMFV